MKSSPIQTSFNGGELSPLIHGRPDVAKFANGCEICENFIPLIQGPAITRPGTWFVQEVKDSGDRTWLIRFERSTSDAYMLEFGDGYVRFYFDHAQVQTSGVAAYSGATDYAPGDLATNAGTTYYCTAATTGNAPPNALYWYALPGSIYEIPSPYTAAQLTNADGTCALRYAQSGDVVFLVHPSHPPHVLSRYGATRWTLAPYALSPPPFKDLNSGTVTVVSSATTGAVTLTASAALFSAQHIGQYLYLAERDVRDVDMWEAAKTVALNDRRRSDGKNYRALNAGTTGSLKPIHTSGTAFDGDGAVEWEFLDSGYGWARITAVASATSATATVVSALPEGASGSKATTRWAFEAWNSNDGYPTAVSFFSERLVFARREMLWFSASADFPNFAYEVSGQVTPACAFDRTLSSDRTNAIRWLSPGDALLVGTLGDEWVITEATTSDAFGPENAHAQRQSTYGSSLVSPQRVGSDTLFVQKAGRKVRAMAFRFDSDGFESPDATAFASHITSPSLIDLAYQQEPWSQVWAARSDGVLVSCTFSREQEVVGWHRHPFAGGAVECVETIPAPGGSRDDLWLIVRYTIAGQTKRYIAYLAEEDNETGSVAQEDWCYSDIALAYSGAPVTTVSGLGHLEGKEVWILADGGHHPSRIVSAGAISLQFAASKVVVGLPSVGILVPINLDGEARSGTPQGKIKRAHLTVIRLLRSLGGRAGSSPELLEDIVYRHPSTPMGTVPPPYSGDVAVEWDADYETRSTVVIQKDRPMPMTVLAVMPQLVVGDGR